ncbi:MAG TPA: ribosome maturation factor RimM [Nitrospiraceae bacterium]|nr:ribosome maturation factor RimM [Nitrospiraceae bacterium]
MSDLVAIGRIVKSFGVKGDVRVKSLSDVPGRFEGLREVTIETPSGKTIETVVSHVRKHLDSYVIGLEALSSPEEAASYRGSLLKIPEDQVPALPDGQYYEFQLIGMTVNDEQGQPLGTLEDIMETGSHPVFVVRGSGREWLVPGRQAVMVSMDIAQRTMVVRRADIVGDEHEV